MRLDSLLTSILPTPLTVSALLLCLASALVLGILTALVFTRGCRHTASFALTLALLPMSVALEIAAIFTAVAIGLAMGMGMLGVAVVFFLLSAAAVLALTKLHFGAMPENAKVLRITVPEDVDYETALPDVFRAHHVTATLEKVRTESMGTLFELTYQVNLPSAVPSKALLDDLRERNGNLPILFTNLGDKDSL